MTSVTILIFVLGAIAVAALAVRLFWPTARREPGPDTNWEQHNDTRMPSLENVPKAGDTAVDAAVAALDLGLS